MNDKAVKRDIGKPSGYRDLLGYRAVVWRDGYAEFEIDIDARHLNSNGFLHGGVYVAVLDTAMSYAATWCGVPGNVRRCVTLTMTQSFVATARTPVVRGIGWLEQVQDRVASCHGEIRDADGKVCVTSLGSYRYMRGSQHVTGVPLENPAMSSATGNGS